MTPSEFKAWFDGFTEAFAGCPTKAQWARIKTRVAEIDGKPVTERIYLDRYWPTYNPPITSPTYLPLRWTSGSATTTCGVNAAAGSHSVSFNSMQALCDLGRAEASSLAA